MGQAISSWNSASVTHTGIRRKINEDAILSRDQDLFWVVADGMGGHEAGDKASKMIVEALSAVPYQAHFSRFVDEVEQSLWQANNDMRSLSAAQFGGRTMGSTVVSMVVNGNVGVCLWAGDSRLYRLRDGELAQISNDHSPVQELVARGILTLDEAERHPDSNVITRAVGGMQELFLDITLFEIEPGDTYLLCSDGLYREVSSENISRILSYDDVQKSVDELLSSSLDNGARDNVSVIVSRAI